jgi:hypothetical protein
MEGRTARGMFVRRNALTERFRNAKYKFVIGMGPGSPAFAMARIAHQRVMDFEA